MRIQKANLFRGHSQEIYQYDGAVVFNNRYFNANVNQRFNGLKNNITIMLDGNIPKYIWNAFKNFYNSPNLKAEIDINIADEYTLHFTHFNWRLMKEGSMKEILSHKKSINEIKKLQDVKRAFFYFLKTENIQSAITKAKTEKYTLFLSKKAIFQ